MLYAARINIRNAIFFFMKYKINNSIYTSLLNKLMRKNNIFRLNNSIVLKVNRRNNKNIINKNIFFEIK
jgi:hypothetical protein